MRSVILEDMSVRTRREKRKKRAELPLEADWLWSCPQGMPLTQIVRTLNFTDEPRTELSARSWADERLFRNDLYRALLPNRGSEALGPHVVWDALDENLLDACAGGRLLVIRDVPAELPAAVQMLVALIGLRRGERGFHWYESRLGARFALVLEGWAAPLVPVRLREAHLYTVTPLGSQSERR